MNELEEIIEGCKSGKKQCQEKLYQQFSGKLFAVCIRYSDNAEDAKDILQDGFVKILQHIGQYKGTGSFEGWMRRIMVNTALQKYRSHKGLYLMDNSENIPEDVSFEHIENEISIKELLKIVQELPPKYRAVFNMFAIEGYSHAEISRELGINEGTSKSNLSRARAILQKKVYKYYKLSSKLKL